MTHAVIVRRFPCIIIGEKRRLLQLEVLGKQLWKPGEEGSLHKIEVYDIAAKAGVSHATVSNALNGQPGVGKKSRTHILHLAEEAGYTGVKNCKITP
jgi:hypothetical protein